MVKIRYDAEKVKDFARIILDKYYAKSVGGRSGFHRSDAIACPLRAYWRLTGEIEQEYSTQSVGILCLGELCHIALHKNFDAQEKIYNLEGIHITVDAIFNGQFPIETKSTRKKIYKKDDLLDSWLEQLAIAMSVMKVNTGYLMILNIITFGLTVWEITMTEQERKVFLNSCKWQILTIADALKKKDPTILSPKYKDCHWCSFKPSNRRKGCPYYKKIEEEK